MVEQRHAHDPDRRRRHGWTAAGRRRRVRGPALMAATVRPAHKGRRHAPVHSANMAKDRAADRRAADAAGAAAIGTGAWVVLPTYEEAENLPGIAFAILAALPGATLLVVDDNSPDGTGRIADDLAKGEPR